MDEGTHLLDETGRWHGRDVRYLEGKWSAIERELPTFETVDFRAEADGPVNPYLRTVLRKPRTLLERPIPVGVVSNTYTLAQHQDVAKRCIEGIRSAGVDPSELRCQVGLTELGEWMNFRVYFPDAYRFEGADGESLGLRLECFNSVDGTSRLIILFGWLRFVCSNGLVIGETRAELSAIHNRNMDLDRINEIIRQGMVLADQDRRRLERWERSSVEPAQIELWADDALAKAWGKKAASRVYHVCRSGRDVELTDPFAGGKPSEKPVRELDPVPGSPSVAASLYDASQALSWVASRRSNSEERVAWQAQIPGLVDALAEIGL